MILGLLMSAFSVQLSYVKLIQFFCLLYVLVLQKAWGYLIWTLPLLSQIKMFPAHSVLLLPVCRLRGS